MMPARRTHPGPAVVLALIILLVCPGVGQAWDFTIKEHELILDVTNTTGYSYYFDNDPNTYDPDKDRTVQLEGLHDDLFHHFFNKLDVSLSYGQFRAGARLDLHLFANSPFEQHCGIPNKPDPSWCVQAPIRYNDQFAAERLYLVVTRPEFDLTLGDFYASFGKGLALSLIQLDELGQDTTVRGGKLNIHHKDLGLTLLAGTINVLDMDNSTGWDAPWQPEPLVGGRLEYNLFGKVLAGTHAVYLIRDNHKLVDANERPENWFGYDAIWGVGFDVPDLWGDRLSFGGELNLQWTLEPAKPVTGEDRKGKHKGTAAYASANLQLGDLSILSEFKYYDDFDLVGFDKKPYVQMYHLPPTLDRKKAEINEGNKSVTGVRFRLDYNVGEIGPLELLLFANYGYFYNWEADAGGLFKVEDGDKRIHSPFGGLEFQWGDGTGQLRASAGGRMVLDQKADGAVYREDVHLELSVEQAVFGNHCVELSFLLLDRKAKRLELDTWKEMELTLGYKWSPHLTVALTYERQEDPNMVAQVPADPSDPASDLIPVPGNLFSAMVRYHFKPGSYLNLRVGESRGGVKCLSGVCRLMPPFAGMELVLVVRM